ncbi:Programmed cell death protein 2 [Fasciola hepatica]|uniref:Programmed cell death protein 2 n=1 Tax=Fasciola hepatica TaxID=6192 RepID=A0A4E0RXD2_FASHE|nr:Programmed cell death protein 2 [Fasciola hepatica]
MCPGLALGFASPAPAWHLISPLFPDKIGGRPAWLALQYLPKPSELSCPTCSQPMVFLLQVYSTLDERVDCFHRFLFVFMCRNGQCHRVERPHPFVVFRSQLARENAYYSFEPPETEEPTRDQIELLVDSGNLPCAEKFNSICPVCGCLADKACARCKKVRYCSRAHQVIHWRLNHKPLCNPGLPAIVKDGPCFTENEILLPEYKICSEMAEECSDILKESDDDNAADEVDVAQDDEDSVLESIAKKETDAEARFRRFREAMADEPEQVIRLQRGGKPIWLSDSPPDVPNCEICGAKRQFEFQVTPQLLNYLKLDQLGSASPDFGSLYVFTCSASCALPRTVSRENGATVTVEYQPEVLIRQLVP